MKLRASERAIQRKAPFHRDKNSINDALLIEAYADFIKEDDKPGGRFAFVTHNYRDFSEPAGNQKHPHPDFARVRDIVMPTEQGAFSSAEILGCGYGLDPRSQNPGLLSHTS